MSEADYSTTAQSLKDYVYEQIFDGILQGKYNTEQVITEKSLGNDFRVSKSPVREALIELCNEGVLRSIPRYGYEVVRLTDQDVRNVLEFRIMLECSSLTNFWHRINLDKVEQLLKEEQTIHDTPEKSALEHWDNNSKFHLNLISYFDNEYIYSRLAQALCVQTRAYAQFYWDHWHRTKFTVTSQYHGEILRNILESNREEAVLALKQDISQFPNENMPFIAKDSDINFPQLL